MNRTRLTQLETAGALALIIIGAVAALLLCGGCAVGWQINMPMAYSQAHSRGSSYNAADAKTMDISGTSEAFQQQRATTAGAGGEALHTSVEAAKATDLASSKGQSQMTKEGSQGVDQGSGTTSGAQTPTATPTKTTSISPTANVAPGGLAASNTNAPNASPGTNAASPSATAAADLPAAREVPEVVPGTKLCAGCGYVLVAESDADGLCKKCAALPAAEKLK